MVAPASCASTGRIGDIRVTNTITLYAALDRVDFDVRIEKPPTTNEQRLLHFFPVSDGAGRPAPRNARRRCCARRRNPTATCCPAPTRAASPCRGSWTISPAGRVGVTIAPLDAYMLRLDQGALAFEALGNDQNWKEVTQDQDGERHFRFRYSLRAHAGLRQRGHHRVEPTVAAPVTVALGRLPGNGSTARTSQSTPPAL